LELEGGIDGVYHVFGRGFEELLSMWKIMGCIDFVLLDFLVALVILNIVNIEFVFINNLFKNILTKI
jgi:hypothetical protein